MNTIPTYVIGVTSPGTTCTYDQNPPNQQDLDSVAKVTPEIIEAGYRDTESWMERLSMVEGSELQSSVASNLQKDEELFLLQYLISELNEPTEDGTELNDEEKGEVFFVVKTVIESFKDQLKRRIIEP